MKKLTTEEFKKRYYEKYGDKYNLEKVNYFNNKKEIIVTCPIHGDFKIRPNDLMMGQGCPYCGGTKKSNTEDFIKKASYVHNNYFSYEKTVYVNSNEKLIVTCPIHGDFEVKANNHLNGANCLKCKREKISHKINKLPKINSSTKKLNEETFKNKFYEKYGNKFILDNIEYVNYTTPIIVICPIHGEFKITPQKLMNGRGCSKCAKNYRYTTEEFINLANEKHNNKYSYEKTIYKSTHKNIIVTCPIHGDFNISPANHLKGQGCPICNESHLEKEINNFLIENNIKFERQKRFKWLGLQSLDFYLPEYNIAIECQGIQHFEPIGFFGGEKGFENIIKRDENKLHLCNDNNIHLIYYSNKKYKNNIITKKEKILKFILNI